MGPAPTPYPGLLPAWEKLLCYHLLTLPIIAGYKGIAIGFLKFFKVAQLSLLSDNLGYFSPTKKVKNYS